MVTLDVVTLLVRALNAARWVCLCLCRGLEKRNKTFVTVDRAETLGTPIAVTKIHAKTPNELLRNIQDWLS